MRVTSKPYISRRYYCPPMREWTTICNVSCSKIWPTKFRIWCQRDSHSLTSPLTYVFHNQIKLMVLWLWRVCNSEATLYIYHSCLFMLPFRLNHVCCPCLYPTKYLQGLWGTISSSSKWRLLVFLHESKFYTRPPHETKQIWKTSYNPNK